jgi:opacity protein-like surface antigen
MKRLLGVAVILLTVSALSFGQLALKGVGGGIGFVSLSPANSTESFSGFLIAAHADLGEFTKDIVFFPDVEYFSTSKDVNGTSLKVSDFALNANVHYNIQMEGMFKPYVGAGLGYNSFSWTFANPFGFGGTYTGSDSRIGINLLAGFNYKLNEMLTLLVEPRYVLAADYGHFIIKAGVTYAMKQ